MAPDFFDGIELAVLSDAVICSLTKPWVKLSLLACVATHSATPRVVDNYARLPDLDFPHPFCEGRIHLDVASPYFVEVENNVPGRDEYNALIRLYERQDWVTLRNEIATFRQTFENSPLREAVAFLEVQILFDTLDTDDTAAAKGAEKKLREVLLLYPNSSLTPVLTGSVAAFYLKAGNYSKSLSLFEAAKQEYPFHKLNCVFQLGAAESNFLVRDYPAAETRYRQILQKCETLRNRVGAEARLLDIEREQGIGKNLVTKYDQLYRNNGVTLSRFFPHVLANLGELKYRQGEYPSAKFFFTEYTRYGTKDNGACMPVVLKRVADTSFRAKEKLSDTVAKYYLARDRFPRNDWGRFSYIRGLLLEMKQVPEPERERRLKVIDAEANLIKLGQLQNQAYLEKGLSLLDAGKLEALPYLMRMDENSTLDLKKGALGAFIRDRLLKVLAHETKVAPGSNDKVRDKSLLEPLEAAYGTWLKGTSFETEARQLYQTLILERLRETLPVNPITALAKLIRWRNSELWPRTLTPSTQRTIGLSITKKLMTLPEKEKLRVAKALIENSEALAPFIAPEFSGIWAYARVTINDEEGLKQMAKRPQARTIAQATPLPKDLASFLSFNEALAARRGGNFERAEKFLDKVQAAEFQKVAIEAYFALYREAGWNSKLLDFGFKNLGKLEVSERVPHLEAMRSALVETKAWRKADLLMRQVNDAGIKSKALAPYTATYGRAQFELSDCRGAIDSFQTTLKLDEDWEGRDEVKFRLGRCYLRTRKSEDAKTVWREVVDAKDPVWSDLAANELKLMESP